MAGDDFRKRRSGDPFTMKAPLYNALIDAARLAKQNRHDLQRLARQEFRQSGIILVRNDSQADRERFDVVGLERPVILPTENLDEFKRQVVMSGVVPRCPAHDGRYAVLLEPVPQGEFGKAVVSGVVQCRLVVDDELDEFAEILDGRAGALGSVDLGSAKILWKESGTGTKWAIVRLSNPQDIAVCSSTSTTAPPTTTTAPPTTTTEPPTTTTGEPPTTTTGEPPTTTTEAPTTTTGEPPTTTTESPATTTTGEPTTTTGQPPTTTTEQPTTTTGEGTTTTGEPPTTTTEPPGTTTTGEGSTTTGEGTTTTGEPTTTTGEGTTTTGEPATTTTGDGTTTTGEPPATTTTGEGDCIVYVPPGIVDGCQLSLSKARLVIENGRIVCEPAGEDVFDLSDCCGCGTTTTPEDTTTTFEGLTNTTAIDNPI